MDNIARTGTWLGLNRAPYVRDGEFTKMKNLSSDSYPYMATRKARKKHTYSFSVKGVPGDGYEAEVQSLPKADSENEGKIYLLNPSFSGYEAGGMYKLKDGAWKKINAYDGRNYLINTKEEIYFCGVYDAPPERLRGHSCYDGTKLYSESTKARNAISEAEHNEKNIARILEKGKDCRCELVRVFGVWQETDYGKITVSSAEVMEEYEKDPFKNNRVGLYFKYTGETTEKYKEGQKYRLLCAVETRWVELDYQAYEAVTTLPQGKIEGDVIKYCGAEQPIKGKNYKPTSELDKDGNIFYYWEKTTSPADKETNTELGEATAEEGVIKYTGDSEATFFECVYSGEKYEWKKTSQPYVSKDLTIKEYIDKYVEDFDFKEIAEIHAHDGEIAALIRSQEDDIYLFVNKQFYKQANMNSPVGNTLTSCGRKIICGGTGSYYDSKDNKYYEGAGMFDFSVPGEAFESFSGKKYVSKAGINDIIIYAAKESELINIAEALNTPGTELEMAGEKQTVKYPYTTAGEENSCRIEKVAWGKKIDGVWVEGKAYRLTIDVENVPETFVREFSNEEIYITSPKRAADTITWKNRLWSYNDNYLIGSIAGIFKGKDIIWNEVNNNYNDSVSQPIWQGGVINAVLPLTDAIIIFKDDCISVFTGETIPTMSVYTVFCPGLKKENAASAVSINDSVFYYSNNSVYRFYGGFPADIGENMKFRGKNAIGGSDGKKYYLSLEEEGIRRLYAYDIAKGIWHAEDDYNGISFAKLSGNVYITDGEEIVYYEDEKENIQWEAEFTYDEGVTYKKKYKQLIVRGSFEECEVWVKADDGEWAVAVLYASGKIKVPPIICEKLTVKLKGIGKAEIRSVDRVFEITEG
jgi:hypothetical protein